MFSADPVDRSSIAKISWPSASNRSARWDPMKPAPPVMRVRTPTLAFRVGGPLGHPSRGPGAGLRSRRAQGRARLARHHPDEHRGPARHLLTLLPQLRERGFEPLLAYG